MKKTTANLIRENSKYVQSTGFDRPWIMEELRLRANAGDEEASKYVNW